MLVPEPGTDFQKISYCYRSEDPKDKDWRSGNFMCFSEFNLDFGGKLVYFNNFRRNIVGGMYFSSPSSTLNVSLDRGRLQAESTEGNSIHLLFVQHKGKNSNLFPYVWNLAPGELTPLGRLRDQAIGAIMKGTCQDIATVKSTEEVLVAESKTTGPNGDKNHVIIILEKSRLEEMFKDEQITPESASKLVSTEMQKDLLAILGNKRL